MRGILVLIGILFFPVFSFSQTRTANSDGNWSNSGSWQGGNIGGAVDNDDDVVINTNIDVTIQAGESYIIASLDPNKNSSLTIDATGSLTITGDFNVAKEFVINVDGDLIVQGNMSVAKSLTFNVTGSVIIQGDVDLAKDATLDIDGTVTVNGDVDFGKDNVVLGTGTLAVTGTCADQDGDDCGDTQILTAGDTLYSIASGNFNASTTWSYFSEGSTCGCIPASTKHVVIEGTDKVTMNVNGEVLSMEVGTGELEWNGDYDLTFYGSNGLLVNTNGVIDAASNGDARMYFNQSNLTYTLENNGTLSCYNPTLQLNSLHEISNISLYNLDFLLLKLVDELHPLN
jgi:hypothetical protein